MNIITTRSFIVTHDGTDYTVPDTYGCAAEWFDPLVGTDDKGHIIVTYIAQDDSGDHENPWERDDDSITYRIFDNGHQRDQFMDDQIENPDAEIFKAQAEGRFFWLERYEHGLVRYALVNESSQTDRQWDVAHGVGYLILDTDWSGDLTEIARALCEEYTAWCNGECYGIVNVTLDLLGEQIDEDTCWGYIGSSYAEQEARDQHAHYIKEQP